MKNLFIAFMFISFSVFSQTEPEQTETTNKQIVKAACGICQFDMEGSSCQLAVKIDGKAYFVDGSSLKDHGDMHSEGGLCTTERDAEVVGEVIDGRFVAEQFKLLPFEKKEEDDHEGHNH